MVKILLEESTRPTAFVQIFVRKVMLLRHYYPLFEWYAERSSCNLTNSSETRKNLLNSTEGLSAEHQSRVITFFRPFSNHL
ncbi:hypothetical protein MUGA111182_18030 [Mucilaginibacter galii]